MATAIYTRVSSSQQTEAGTVVSQVAALRERVAGLSWSEACCFIDEGYSGATLVRPALERLRDAVAFGAIDLLSRKYSYQMLLLEELGRGGVKVIFLNHGGSPSPVEDLLLQVQGGRPNRSRR